jgi:hypothetical protein
MGPDLFPVCGVYSHDGIVFRQHVSNGIYDEWCEKIGVVIACRIGPGLFKAGYIGMVYLIETGVLRSVCTAGVATPRCVVVCDGMLLLSTTDQGQDEACGVATK